MRLILLLFTACAFSLASPVAAQKNCKKGIPCGNTCIAANKVCRVGTPTPPAARITPPGLTTLVPDSLEGPWVASPRGRVYYANSVACKGGRKLKARLFFGTEDEAIAAGYTRSTQKGC